MCVYVLLSSFISTQGFKSRKYFPFVLSHFAQARIKFFSVAKKSDKNLMTVGNLAVCFGPTLLRPEEETVASIMDIKFYNIVVEMLIENCERIVAGPPQDSLQRAVVAQSTMQATVIPNKSQCIKVDEGPTSSGNGTVF